MTRLTRYYSPLDRVFSAVLSTAGDVANGNGASASAIALDVLETPELYIVKADLPGVAKEQIDVKVEDRDVTISVETRDQTDDTAKPLWTERQAGKASRAIRLPEAVDATGAQARHVDGVLQLTLPKLTKSQSKITIQ